MELRCSDLDNLALEGSLFDLVTFRGAYFFLDEEGKIIREVYRVLRKDGLAFLPDPGDMPFLEVAASADALSVTGNTRHYPKRSRLR
jgi:ubiquinone/menaquinone biosynthesis C-methylase UbiE